MKIQMLRNAPHLMHCPLKEGQTGEINDRDGEQLVKLGLGKRLDDPAPLRAVPQAAPIQAVPPEPPVAPAPVEPPSEPAPLSKRQRRKQQQPLSTNDSQDKE